MLCLLFPNQSFIVKIECNLIQLKYISISLIIEKPIELGKFDMDLVENYYFLGVCIFVPTTLLRCCFCSIDLYIRIFMQFILFCLGLGLRLWCWWFLFIIETEKWPDIGVASPGIISTCCSRVDFRVHMRSDIFKLCIKCTNITSRKLKLTCNSVTA